MHVKWFYKVSCGCNSPSYTEWHFVRAESQDLLSAQSVLTFEFFFKLSWQITVFTLMHFEKQNNLKQSWYRLTYSNTKCKKSKTFPDLTSSHWKSHSAPTMCSRVEDKEPNCSHSCLCWYKMAQFSSFPLNRLPWMAQDVTVELHTDAQGWILCFL